MPRPADALPSGSAAPTASDRWKSADAEESAPGIGDEPAPPIAEEPSSSDVLTGALALTSGEAAQLTAMHAVTGVEAADAFQSPARWMVPEYRTHIIDDARRTLDAVVSAVPARVDLRLQVATGSAARAILDHAVGVDADLVVVGRSRGFRPLGSTALRILRKNDRALLVIPSGVGGVRRTDERLAA